MDKLTVLTAHRIPTMDAGRPTADAVASHFAPVPSLAKPQLNLPRSLAGI